MKYSKIVLGQMFNNLGKLKAWLPFEFLNKVAIDSN
jgi:hypothetical protein